MPSDHPPSPQSPNNQPFDTADCSHKLATSPSLGNNSLPTPAHSINGSMSSLNDLPAFADPVNPDESSNKRKREEGDNGDREQKKVHIEDRSVTMEDLHLDVGPMYKLCNTPHSVAPIPYADDLFQRYGLTDIAESVARNKPDGSKVVIRKSYKGYIQKTLKLSGAFDSVKKEADDPSTLFAMMSIPDEHWNGSSMPYAAAAKEVKTGLPALVSSLPKAVAFAKCSIPKDLWNDKVLNQSDTAKLAPVEVKTAHNGNKTPTHVPGSQRSVKTEAQRPKRATKRRTYGDTSFEGYGEGYVDDELQDPGYSTSGDGEERARKRPKKFGVPQASGIQRHSSYGPGSIGV